MREDFIVVYNMITEIIVCSIFGSRFFIIYTNDLPAALMNSNLYYLMMTPVYFFNIVTWMYLPVILRRTMDVT